LNATFLLAISTPMVNLPLERINKYRNDGGANAVPAGHMNDIPLNQGLGDAVKLAIDADVKLDAAPFFIAGAWRYQELPKATGFPNLAQDGLPEDLVGKLSEEASEAGALISTKLFCEILRNALAHGGILFLNEQGRSSVDDPVRKFVFVSTNRMRNPTSLHFLRIGMRDYRAFLDKWVEWLTSSGLQQELEEVIGERVAVV